MVVSIRAAARLLGVSAKTLRDFDEKRYGLHVRWTRGRHRRYDIDEVLEVRRKMEICGLSK